jgi:hypothetical protein
VLCSTCNPLVWRVAAGVGGGFVSGPGGHEDEGRAGVGVGPVVHLEGGSTGVGGCGAGARWEGERGAVCD